VHAVSESEEERRQNHALRRRIDQLIGRVRAAEDEIVERGLDAVPGDEAGGRRRAAASAAPAAAEPDQGSA
jgi:uncharacterized Ntn-hydrolase superfamily protein